MNIADTDLAPFENRYGKWQFVFDATTPFSSCLQLEISEDYSNPLPGSQPVRMLQLRESYTKEKVNKTAAWLGVAPSLIEVLIETASQFQGMELCAVQTAYEPGRLSIWPLWKIPSSYSWEAPLANWITKFPTRFKEVLDDYIQQNENKPFGG